MIRVCDFQMEGVKLKIASMSFSLAEKYVKESGELLARTDVKPEEWMTREHQTVLEALNRANSNGDGSWTVERIRDEMDIPTINAIYLRILEISGLRPTGESKGEAKAA
jgi:hypothetical protein